MVRVFGRILLAVDGSDQNKNAVRDAVTLASKLGSKITAVYVDGRNRAQTQCIRRRCRVE